MRRYFDLRHDESVSVYENGSCEDYVEKELMIAGHSFAPKPDEPTSEVEEPDVEVFDICGLTFTDKETAESFYNLVVDSIGKILKIEHDWNSSTHFVESVLTEDNYGFPEVKRRKIYSKSLWLTNKARLKDFKTKKAAYDEEYKKWKDNHLKNDDIKDKVYSWFSIHKSIKRLKEHHQNVFNRYLNMADGNEEMARKFFLANESCSFMIDGHNCLDVLEGKITEVDFVKGVLEIENVDGSAESSAT